MHAFCFTPPNESTRHRIKDLKETGGKSSAWWMELHKIVGILEEDKVMFSCPEVIRLFAKV